MKGRVFMRKRLLSILLCLVMVTGLLPTALAVDEEGGNSTDEPTTGSVIYVDANDTSDGAGDGTKDNPYKDLATAVKQATNGTTIQLGEGNYSLYTVCGNDKGAGKSKEYTSGKNLTFVGAGRDKTTWYIGANPTPEGYNGVLQTKVNS